MWVLILVAGREGRTTAEPSDYLQLGNCDDPSNPIRIGPTGKVVVKFWAAKRVMGEMVSGPTRMGMAVPPPNADLLTL